MKATTPYTAIVFLLAAAVGGCDKSDTSSETSDPVTTTAAAKTEPTKEPAAKTKTEKVTMNGVSWQVTLPEEMKAPQYKVKTPEFMSKNFKLKLSTSVPKFSSADAYIKRNIPGKVLEKVEVGPAVLIITEPSGDKVIYNAIVPDDTIGWHCSGPKEREADVRAMCKSVTFEKEE